MAETPLKNIIWCGTGRVGLPVLQKLLPTDLFNIKLLVRKPISTYTAISHLTSFQNLSICQVNFSDRSELVNHLRGYDAVIVFCNFVPTPETRKQPFMYGDSFDTKHIVLIDAAIEAGVKHILPSEWALDSAGVMGQSSKSWGPMLPTHMVLAPKRVVHNYVLCRAGEGRIRFASICCGVLSEACFNNVLFRFDFASRTASLPDGGINPFPATTIATLATSIATLFRNPSLISNRWYHISDGVLTQLDILDIIQQQSSLPWTISSFSIEQEREDALKNMQDGVYTIKEFRNSLMTPFFGALQTWTHVDNDVLKIAERADLRSDVERLVKGKIDRAEEERVKARESGP